MRHRGTETVTPAKAAKAARAAGEVWTRYDPSAGSTHVASPAGAAPAVDVLFAAAYEELRRLAATVRRGDPSATLNPTALVNEAWLKLARSPGVRFTSNLHFKRVAARAMRQVLVEAARRRRSDKRGSGMPALSLEAVAVAAPARAADLLALDAALDQLARLNPRQAALVEARFFAGLDVAESAEMLEVSPATALRDWRAARAWLSSELQAGG